MKKHLLILIAGLILTTSACQQSEPKSAPEQQLESAPEQQPESAPEQQPESNSITGQMIHLKNFESQFVDARNIEIWFPPSYDSTNASRYPVLYMHDGQSLFEPGHTFTNNEWGVDEVLTEVMSAGGIKEAIVVGIWNTNKRFREYQPTKPFIGDQFSMIRDSLDNEYGGAPLADEYLKFIVTELKPFIDSNFKTMPEKTNTTLAGSSMGGLISIYAAAEYPNIFSRVACISTHWPVSLKQNDPLVAGAIIDYLSTKLSPKNDVKIYFDYGTETLDAWYQDHQVKMDGVMKNLGFDDSNWTTRKFEGHEHSEISWNERLEIPMAFLLGD